MLRNHNPYQVFIKAYFLGLIFFSLSRLMLILWQIDAVLATDQLMNIFLQGVRVDLMQLGFMLVIPMLLFPVNLIHKNLSSFYQNFTQYWIVISFILLVIIEACSITFIHEYNTRPNILFIEYLKYPREVFKMLFKGFFLDIIFVFFSIGVLGRFVYKKFQCSIDFTFNFKHLIL